MFYDDEQTKEFEKKFKQWTEQLKELTPEKMQEIKTALATMEKGFTALKNKKTITAEEKELLKRMAKVVAELKQRMADTMLVLGEKMFRNANAIYQQIKKKAAEGDKKAIKALKEIEPEYRAMLREQHPEN